MPSEKSPPPGPERWQFLRDVLVFQVKLLVDGLRDAVLVPVSIGAALIDLVSSDRPRGRWFYGTLVQGRRSEDWIDLFEAADRVDPRGGEPHEGRATGLDDVARRLEAVLAEQHARGGVTASAKKAIDRLLDSVEPPRR